MTDCECNEDGRDTSGGGGSEAASGASENPNSNEGGDLAQSEEEGANEELKVGTKHLLLVKASNNV